MWHFILNSTAKVDIEEMLISGVLPIMSLYCLPHGLYGYSRDVINLPQMSLLQTPYHNYPVSYGCHSGEKRSRLTTAWFSCEERFVVLWHFNGCWLTTSATTTFVLTLCSCSASRRWGLDWPVLYDTGVFWWWLRIAIFTGCRCLWCSPCKNFCPKYCPETNRGGDHLTLTMVLKGSTTQQDYRRMHHTGVVPTTWFVWCTTWLVPGNPFALG